MFTINENIKNEIVINKSRFITYIYKIDNENNINEILNNLKKEYRFLAMSALLVLFYERGLFLYK